MKDKTPASDTFGILGVEFLKGFAGKNLAEFGHFGGGFWVARGAKNPLERRRKYDYLRQPRKERICWQGC
jgi:hypothetical protein